MVSEETSYVSTRRRQAISAAVGVTLTCLPLFGNYAAFLLGYPELGASLLALPLWPLMIFVPVLGWLGFESYWIPHPLALVATLAFAVAVYSLLAYAILTLYSTSRK